MSRDGGFQAVRAVGEKLQIRTFFFKKKKTKKNTRFYSVNFGTFWRSGGKHPFGWWKIKKKSGNLGDSARGQADPGSAAVYTMDWPGPVICMYVYVGTVSHLLGPIDPLVVAIRRTAVFLEYEY
jgi:hypothetical protein